MPISLIDSVKPQIVYLMVMLHQSHWDISSGTSQCLYNILWQSFWLFRREQNGMPTGWQNNIDIGQSHNHGLLHAAYMPKNVLVIGCSVNYAGRTLGRK